VSSPVVSLDRIAPQDGESLIFTEKVLSDARVALENHSFKNPTLRSIFGSGFEPSYTAVGLEVKRQGSTIKEIKISTVRDGSSRVKYEVTLYEDDPDCKPLADFINNSP
jgi:hypothetical protein